MDELYLLDKDLIKKYIIDMYSSILWVPRYNELGDCELVISATIENIKKIKECKYIARKKDDMVCEITKIEIEENEQLDTIDKIKEELGKLNIPIYTNDYFIKKAEIELKKIL